MQNKFLRVLILSIAVAVISLIAMQFYWVRSSVTMQKEEFNRKVSDALKSVSDYLEKYEAITQLKAHEQNRYLFIDDHAEEKIISAGGDTTYEYLMVEKYVQEDDHLQISVTEEKNGDTISESKDVQKIKSPVLNSDQQFQIGGASNVGQINFGGFFDDSDVAEKMANKSAFIGEIAKSLTKVNFAQSLEDRIDSALLDSLLNLALFERGIEGDYEFGVYDYNGVFRFGKPYEMSQNLQASRFKTRLFVHDLLGKPGYLKIFFPKEKGIVFQNTWYMLGTSLLVVLAIIFIFFWTVKAIITQKKNSEIKNDFINNMTHELKTPISTISLAVEVLNDPAMSENKGLVNRYLSMINEENKRLGMLVEEVLQSAALDRNAFKLKKETLQLDQLVKEVVAKMQIKVKERKGVTTVSVDDSGYYEFDGDKVHLTNVMYNLLDNAIKYSREQPEIKIEVLNVVNQIAIKVSDNGIGISPDHQKKVFEKLYRVPTGNLHDVKGFGLGLNYVKTIVSRHGGTVDVKSILGKGSTFSIYLPKKIKE